MNIFKMHFLVFIGIMLSIVACDSSDEPNTQSQFIASESDFIGYSNWSKIDERVGEDPAGYTKGAHGAADSSILRKIFVKQSGVVRNESNQFPLGTIFAKEMSINGVTDIITIMTKRGGDYDEGGNNWEYFMVSPSGSILGRGDTLMGGGCKGCHSFAGTGRDFIFSK